MQDKVYIFESMPVPKAVASLAIPTILSHLVTMIYNLADTFFIGQTGDPNMVAGVAVVYPLFFVLNTITSLFGIGGGSLISRMLGAKESENAKKVSSFCFYTSMIISLIYSLLVFINMNNLLQLLGASSNTINYARDYLVWVVIIGSVPTTIGLVLVHLLRSEGCAKQASIGIAIGGIINIILDPILIFSLGMGVKGAAIATMISNVITVIYYFYVLSRIKSRTVLSIKLSNYTIKKAMIAPIFIVGLPAALVTLFAFICNVIMNKLISGYGDIQVAAWGIVRKIDMIATNVGMGLSQGVLPLIAYNYAAKNYSRMKSISRFARIVGMTFAFFCVVVFELLAPNLINIFIKNNDTIVVGTVFLRIACVATPFIIMNFLMNTTFQAMGKGKQSLILTICRQAILHIPLIFLFDKIIPLYGIFWSQIVTDTITVVISLILYRGIIASLKKMSEV